MPIPVDMDPGDVELLNHPNGPAHFGAWMAMVRIAAAQDIQNRGMLPGASGVNPHDIPGICRALAGLSNFPVTVFDELIPRLLSDKIAWLEEVDEHGTPIKLKDCAETNEHD